MTSGSLLKFITIELLMLSNHLILCCPLFLLPPIFPSIRERFSNESAFHIRWPKCSSFIFSISPSNEYLWLISFRIDWFDLLSVQRTLKNLLQHHNSKASIFWCSTFFMAQFSHLYTWELVQSTDSWVLLKTYCIRNSGCETNSL